MASEKEGKELTGEDKIFFLVCKSGSATRALLLAKFTVWYSRGSSFLETSYFFQFKLLRITFLITLCLLAHLLNVVVFMLFICHLLLILFPSERPCLKYSLSSDEFIV